jgi:hypothetical protein
MNQIDNVGGLAGAPLFGVNQRFSDFATFDGGVYDNFRASGSTIDKVGVAMEFTDPASRTNWATRITDWKVAVHTSKAAAAGDASFSGVFGQTVGNANVTKTDLGAPANAARFDITGLSIGGLTVGNVYWISVTPAMAFAGNGQTFILQNSTPLILGNGDANTAFGTNPGNGFGGGTLWDNLNYNAALAVNTVPEPATMIALGAGLAALAARRRRK